MVHVANHHIAPGKKQWTWGNQEFGYAWDRSLTDSDGPYVELMAGVYTDNQPDFSCLAPGETKSFSQYWYPIREIGVPDLANPFGCRIPTERVSGKVIAHLLVTANVARSRGSLCKQKARRSRSGTASLIPEQPLAYGVAASSSNEPEIEVLLKAGAGPRGRG